MLLSLLLAGVCLAQNANPFQELDQRFEKRSRELNSAFHIRSDEMLRQYQKRIGELEALWDKVALPGPREFVQYTDDLGQRMVLDFEHDRILMESVAGKLNTGDAEAFLNKLRQEGSDTLDMLLPSPEAFRKDSEGAEEVSVEGKSLTGKPVQRNSISIPIQGWSNRRAGIFWPKVKLIAGRLGIDPALAMAIIQVESAFNPMAVSGDNAIGLMQVVPETAGADVNTLLYGEGRGAPSVGDLYDPETNILYGVGYIRLLERYFPGFTKTNNLPLLIAAYNAGPGRVRGLMQNWKNAAAWPAGKLKREIREAFRKAGIMETAHYLDQVFKQYEKFKDLLGVDDAG